MDPVIYALFSYALTAVISFAVVGIIVLIDRFMITVREKDLLIQLFVLLTLVT